MHNLILFIHKNETELWKSVDGNGKYTEWSNQAQEKKMLNPEPCFKFRILYLNLGVFTEASEQQQRHMGSQLKGE